MTALEILAFALALVPVTIGIPGLLLLARAQGTPPEGTRVSILIPARDEEANIAACLEAAAASRCVEVEILVMDDGSTDRTAGIVREYAARDPRIRLLSCPPLPPGWTGKVHACQRLADAASGTHLLFLDADVRLEPDAAAAMAAHAQKHGVALVSGVPRQIIGSPGEALTVPMINLLMLCYLPGAGRAFTRHPGFAAATGQLLLAEAGAYRAAGGHEAVRQRLHDGIALARRMRACGFRTEIVDGSALASCRMYTGFAQSWRGFLKNAHEGMATPVGLPVWTLLLAGGHILPWLLLPAPLAFAALCCSVCMRVGVTLRMGEPAWTILMHPAAVAVALAIQWASLLRRLCGRPAQWRGRAYAAGGGP
ncbi:MAG: glycosyltransferase family 2 protein [Acetobacteraceae bacterium]|nr:glycosyltransferase family 2 protein [Acetobacteraceae bacterium]